MKRNLVVMAAAFASISTCALAQRVNPYEGFYGQVAVGYERETVGSSTLKDTASTPVSVSVSGANKGGVAGVIGVGYNFGINKNWVVGVGIDYGAVPSKSFNAPGTDTVGLTVSKRYNIFLTPGYAFGEQMVYAKVGYSNEYLQATYQNPGPYLGQSIGNTNASGYVLGLGYKTALASNVYGYLEANYYNYSSPTFGTTTLSNTKTISSYSPSLSAYQALAGLGYRFF